MKRLIIKSVLAGFLIAVAGSIFLQCENKVIGALLFGIGLIGVIILQANLFTGKVGYINNKETCLNAIVILAINVIVAFSMGLLYRLCCGTTAAMDSRMIKTWYRLLWDGMICGVCIYLAVECYAKTKNIITIIIPVMAFILSGAEHCIADAFYFGTSEFTSSGLLSIIIVTIGNSVGSLLTRFLQVSFEK